MSLTTTSTGSMTPLDYLQSLLGKSTQGNSAAGQVGTQGATGVGVAADVSQAPEATKAMVVSTMMESIAAFMPAKSEDDVDVLVATATAKLKETMNKSQAAQIHVNEEQKREQAQQAEKKYKDAEQKIQDAKSAMAHANIFEKIKLAFEYLGAILSILAGIAVMIAGIATGVAAAPAVAGGILLITSGLLMLTLAVNDTVAQSTAKDGQPGMGMFQMAFAAIAKDAGLDPNSGEGAKLVKWGSFAVQTTLMIVALVAGVVGSIVAPEASVSDLVEAGETIMNAVRGGTDAAEGVEDTVQTTSTVAKTGEEVADVTEDAQSNISALASKVADKVQDLGSTAKSFVKDPGKIADKAAEMGQKVVDKAQDLGQSAVDKAQGMVQSVVDNAETIAKDPSQIFGMAKDFAKETASGALAALKAKPIQVMQRAQDTTSALVSSTSDIATSEYNLQASQDTNDADSLKADAKAFEALNKVLDEFIDIALGQLKKASQQMNAVLDSVMDSKKDVSDSLNQFRFSA